MLSIAATCRFEGRSLRGPCVREIEKAVNMKLLRKRLTNSRSLHQTRTAVLYGKHCKRTCQSTNMYTNAVKFELHMYISLKVAASSAVERSRRRNHCEKYSKISEFFRRYGASKPLNPAADHSERAWTTT